MHLSMDEETAEQENARLHRELDHLDSQCKTAHTMAMSLMDEKQALQKTVASLEKKLNTARRKLHEKSGLPTRRATDPGDAILDWLQGQEHEDQDEQDARRLEQGDEGEDKDQGKHPNGQRVSEAPLATRAVKAEQPESSTGGIIA